MKKNIVTSILLLVCVVSITQTNISEDDKKIWTEEREQYYDTVKYLYYLPLGIYTYSDYQLTLRSNGKYLLNDRQNSLSQGLWKRFRNEITFIDNKVDTLFFLLIAEDGLFGKYMPFNNSNRSCKFIIIQEEKESNNYWHDSGRVPVLEPKNTEPYYIVDQMPEFPKGDTALIKYLKNNLSYPDAAKKAGTKGKVYVRFVVEPNGSFSNIRVVKSLSPECDAEAIRLVKSMPRWIPGKLQGQNVAVWYTVPLSFPCN